MASSSPVKVEMIENESSLTEQVNREMPTAVAPILETVTPAAAATAATPTATPVATESSSNVDKMLQVFQQLASQQGTQSAGIQQQILQQQVMQQLQLQQAVAAVQTLQKQLSDQFELARNLVRDLQHSPSKQSNQQSTGSVFSHGQVRAGSVAEGLSTGRQSGASCRSMLTLGQPQGSPNPPPSSSASNRNDMMANGHSNSSVSLLRPQHGLPPLAARGRPHYHPGQMDDSIQLEELERFAKDFKQKRIKLGFTQGDVGVAMGRLYGSDFSQTTISRFEALNLSFKNMCKLKPILERWLDDAERYLNPSSTSMTEQQLESARRRKKRTSIDSTIKVALEMAFLRNSRPSSADISKLAEELEMERETVRVWFCNRRQKEKRIGSNGDEESVSNPDSPASPEQAALNAPQIPLHPSSPTPNSTAPFNAMAAAVAAAAAPPSNGANGNWSGNLDFYRHFASNLNHKNFVMAAQAAQAAAVQAAQQAQQSDVGVNQPFSFFPNMSPMMAPTQTGAEVTELSAQQKPIAS